MTIMNKTEALKTYVAEFNRAKGDNIRLIESHLQRRGIDATRLPHPTTILIERPSTMPWRDFKDAIRSVLQPRRGSVMIASQTTGKVFICSNRGNRPGLFQRVA